MVEYASRKSTDQLIGDFSSVTGENSFEKYFTYWSNFGAVNEAAAKSSGGALHKLKND